MKENIIIPKNEKKIKEEAPYLVTEVFYNNTNYYLYSDGKLYKKSDNDELIELDNSTESGKKLIKEIMNMFKAGKTDILN